MPSGFINDGYTRTEIVESPNGDFDSVEIVYRPLIRREHWDFTRQQKQITDRSKESERGLDIVDALDESRARIVVDHLVSWNLKDSNDNAVEITPENDSYTPGAEVQLNPVPKSGWMFHGWSGDLSGISNPASIIMDQNRTITATFRVDGNPDTISTGTSDGTENDDGGGKGGCFIDITLAVGLFCHDGSKEKN